MLHYDLGSFEKFWLVWFGKTETCGLSVRFGLPGYHHVPEQHFAPFLLPKVFRVIVHIH